MKKQQRSPPHRKPNRTKASSRIRYAGPPGSPRYNCATFEDRASGNESILAGRQVVAQLIRKIARAMDEYGDVAWSLVHGGDQEGCEEHFEMQLDFSGRTKPLATDQAQTKEPLPLATTEAANDSKSERQLAPPPPALIISAGPSPPRLSTLASSSLSSSTLAALTVVGSDRGADDLQGVTELCRQDPMLLGSAESRPPPPEASTVGGKRKRRPPIRLDRLGRPYVCVRCWDSRPTKGPKARCRRCSLSVRAPRDTLVKPTRFVDFGCLECHKTVPGCRCPSGAREGCLTCNQPQRGCRCPFRSDVHPGTHQVRHKRHRSSSTAH